MIVIERARFGALRRSVRLTKDYRWPIALIYLMILVSAMFVGFFNDDLILVTAESIGLVRTTIVAAAMDAVFVGLSGISVALVYARLFDIKEGMTSDQLADVFD